MKKILILLFCLSVFSVYSQINVADLFEDDLEVYNYYLNKEKCTALELGSMGLEKLPLDLLEYKNVKKINLANNPLLDFDEVFDKLKFLHNLEELILSSNKLIFIPKSIGEIKTLREIDFGNNNLKKIPKEIKNLNLLELLDLSSNQEIKIKSLRNAPITIKYLQLGRTDIVKMPSSILRFKLLKSLYLGNNKLQTLPCSLLKLKKLEFIYLGGNPLEYLPICLKSAKAFINSFPEDAFK